MSPYRRNCLEEMGAQCVACPDNDRVVGMDNIVVHHIDGDRSNNMIDNLIPVCHSCHAKIHFGSPGYEDWYDQLNESAQRGSDGPTTGDMTALTMYLYPEQVNELDLRFQEINLKYQREHGEKLQKNADFYPAVFEAAHSNKTVSEVLELTED